MSINTTALGTAKEIEKFNSTNYRYKIVVKAKNKNKLEYHQSADYTSKVLGKLEDGKTYYSDEQKHSSSWNEYYWHLEDPKGWIAESEALDKCTITQEKRDVRWDIVTSDKKRIVVRTAADPKSDQIKVLVEGAKIVATKTVTGTDGKKWYYI